MKNKIKKTIDYLLSVYWEETTIRISDNEVIELGGFIISLLILSGLLLLLNYMGYLRL